MSEAVRRTPRLAVNPISYWLVNGRVDKSKEVFDAAFRDFQAIGYTAVKADIPDGMSATDYLDWIGSYGLSPSVSLFSSPLDETIDIAAELERARAFAGAQAALGMDRAMVSSMLIKARMAAPGTGADYRQDRFDLCLHHLGQLCEVFAHEGIHAVLHNHIGGVFETCRTLIWNGPLGAFEIAPFDKATNAAAVKAAELTRSGRLVSVAGGGDTVAALNQAGVAGDFSYVSTAGGAFLEWMEGKPLPGVAALMVS